MKTKIESINEIAKEYHLRVNSATSSYLENNNADHEYLEQHRKVVEALTTLLDNYVKSYESKYQFESKLLWFTDNNKTETK